MKFKNILFLTGMLWPVSSAFAQYAEDALRFSQTEHGTTSRFAGMGGAQTALGGDASSLASNPAGLGLFTRSELSFTPGISNSTLNSNYLTTSSSIQKDRAGINQFALVFYNPSRRYNSTEATTGWLSFNFGIAYNKTNNFNATTDYGGINPRSSFGDYLAQLAADPDNKLATAGYESYLIELDSVSDTYYPLTDVDNTQRNTIYRSGNQSEVNFSLGGNYSNQLYIGASIGLASINFLADREFTEQGLTIDQAGINDANLTVYNETKPYLNGSYNLAYRSNQETRGSGINAKLGFIYRASKAVRFGMSFISPTWYTISDEFSEGLNNRAKKGNGLTESLNNPDINQPNDYTLRTPYRLNGGIAMILGNRGLISADVEYVDYASIRYTTENRQVERETNNDIRDLYQSALNFRVGAEMKFNPVLLRLGFNTTGNPYQQVSVTSNTLSAGLGYRVNNFSFDLTYSNFTSRYSDRPYLINPGYRYFSDTGNGESVSIEDKRNNVFATIGLRF